MSATTLSHLPNELLELIFQEADNKTLLSIGSVSRRFREVARGFIFHHLELQFSSPDAPENNRVHGHAYDRAKWREVLGCLFLCVKCVYSCTLKSPVNSLRKSGKKVWRGGMLTACPKLLDNPAAMAVKDYPVHVNLTKRLTPKTARAKKVLSSKELSEAILPYVKEVLISWNGDEDFGDSRYVDFTTFVGRRWHRMLDAMIHLKVLYVHITPPLSPTMVLEADTTLLEAFFETIYQRKPELPLHVALTGINVNNCGCLRFLSRVSSLSINFDPYLYHSFAGLRGTPRLERFIADVLNRSPDARYLSFSGPRVSFGRILQQVMPGNDLPLRSIKVGWGNPPVAAVSRLRNLEEIVTLGQNDSVNDDYTDGLKAMWKSVYDSELELRVIETLLLSGPYLLDVISSYGSNLKKLSLYIDENHLPYYLIDDIADRFWDDVLPVVASKLTHLAVLPAHPCNLAEICIRQRNLELFSAVNFEEALLDFTHLEYLGCYAVVSPHEDPACWRFIRRDKCPSLQRVKFKMLLLGGDISRQELWDSPPGAGDLVRGKMEMIVFRVEGGQEDQPPYTAGAMTASVHSAYERRNGRWERPQVLFSDLKKFDPFWTW